MKTLYKYVVSGAVVYYVYQNLPLMQQLDYSCLQGLNGECKSEVAKEFSKISQKYESKTCDSRMSSACHLARHKVHDPTSKCYAKYKEKKIKTLEKFLETKSDKIEYKWLLEQHRRNQDLWQGHLPNSSMKVIVYMGLLDAKSHMQIREGLYSGGPLGEMIQWSSILAALDSYSTNLTVVTSLDQMGLKRGLCFADSTLADTDILVTDIIGAKLLKSIGSTFYSSLKCRLRVLDSFGTDAFFNHPSVSLDKRRSLTRFFLESRIKWLQKPVGPIGLEPKAVLG